MTIGLAAVAAGGWTLAQATQRAADQVEPQGNNFQDGINYDVLPELPEPRNAAQNPQGRTKLGVSEVHAEREMTFREALIGTTNELAPGYDRARVEREADEAVREVERARREVDRAAARSRAAAATKPN